MYTLSGYGVYFSPDFTERSPLRILSEYEIELYAHANGQGFLNGEEFDYPENQVCVFRPGQQRQSHGKFQCYYLRFSCHQPEIRKYLDNLPFMLPTGNTQRIFQLFNDIMDSMTQMLPGYKLYVSAKITEMISILYDMSCYAANVGGKFSVYNAEIYDAIQFMKDHIAEHITLEDIARSVHLSPSFFHLAFKNIIGMTPHKYLLNLRLNIAKSLLVNSDLSLAVIAEQAGFDSQVYFNYIIKKELGITPKKYRDTHRNKHYL